MSTPLGSFWDDLFGRRPRIQNIPTLTPEQQSTLYDVGMQRQAMGQGGYSDALKYLQSLVSGDRSTLEGFEAPYKQQFEQEILPQIAERYGGANAMGSGLSSSGFGQALSGAGAQLQSQLARLRSELQQGASDRLINQYNTLTGQQLGTQAFTPSYLPGSEGVLGKFASAIGGSASLPIGVATGTAITDLMKRLMSRLGMGSR